MGHLLTILQKNKIIVQDGFNRADNALSMGNANTGQAWTAGVGTWGVIGDKAYCPSGTDGNIVTINGRSLDYAFKCMARDTHMSATQVRAALIAKYIDANNFLIIRVDTNNLALIKKEAGVFTAISSATVPTIANGTDYLYEVICSKDNVKVKLNGVQYINTSVPSLYRSSTVLGLILGMTGAAANDARWNDLIVEEI